MSVSTVIITDEIREVRGYNVTYKGKLPGLETYQNLITILVNDRGKESLLRVSEKKLDAALEKWGPQVVRVLGKGKALAPQKAA